MNVPHRYLAVGALILGLLALFVRNPKDTSRVNVDVQELARAIEREEDHVTVDELASILMEGHHRIRILDLRDSASFAQYHIPGARRVGMFYLVSERLSPGDTTVLYSDGGIHAAQAWMLLAAKGLKNVYTLQGGLNEWSDRILFPHIDSSMKPEEKKRMSIRAKFFGGESVEGESMRNKFRIKTPTQKPLKKETEKTREVC